MSFSDNVIALMDAVAKQFGIVVDWTNANVLPYLEQLGGRIINYELAMCTFGLIISAIFIIISIKLWKKTKVLYNKDSGGFLITGVLFIIIAIIVAMALWYDITGIITALTLPEKTLIEFIMQFK